MWAVIHHLLLAVAVTALGGAALRLASLAAPRGLERAIAAAPLAGAGAVASALGLGLVGLGSSPAALTATAVGLWLGSRRLPAPAVPASRDFSDWWRSRSRAERAGVGALAGLVLVYAAWLTRYPYIGVDGLAYHLPDVVAWVQDGRPGSQHEVLALIPVENYPVTHEVLVTWFAAIARAFTPIAPLQMALLVLLGASIRTGLGALAVPRAVALSAAAAVVTIPLLVGELTGPLTDLPTVAWLACAAALAAAAVRPGRPLLLAPALVAAGLAVGTRTTAAPAALVALGLATWVLHRRKALPVRPLVYAAAAAVVVGGVWYLRNLVQHGSPLWPLVAAPWGDPQPDFLGRFDVRFVENAGDTLSEHFRDYRVQLAGALTLMAGALASPLWARRRDALAASGVALVLVGAWTVAPYTGMAAQPVFSELAISTIRYLLPAALACAVAVAIGARAPGRTARTGALLVLTGAATWNIVEDVRAGFPYVPSAFTLLAALAAGAVVALAAGGLLRHRLLVATATPALVLVAALALALGADGYLDRHVDTGFGDAGVVAWFATRPGFADDTRQIAQAPIVNGLLAGDRLRHPVPLIAPNEPCTRVRERTTEGWVVVARSPFPEYDAIARRIEACLSDTPPAYADPGYRVYGPPG